MTFIEFRHFIFRRFFKPELRHIQGRCYHSLAFSNPSDFKVYHQYIHMLNMVRQIPDLRVGIEIGGGYSTYLMANLKDEFDAQVICVDFTMSTVEEIGGSSLERVLAPRVDLRREASIPAKVFRDFYESGPRKSLFGVPAADLMTALPAFYRAYEAVPGLDFEAYLSRLFPTTSTIDVSPANMEFMTEYSGDLAFLEGVPGNKGNAIDRILNEYPELDFVFFDSGEFASVVEFELLQSRISVGGLAILHDIYFPKSVKNFLVAAALTANPDWDVLYVDRSTDQGMLIARRLA